MNTTKLAHTDRKIQELNEKLTNLNKTIETLSGKPFVTSIKSGEFSAYDRSTSLLCTNTSKTVGDMNTQPITDNTTELVMCIHSNTQFLDFRELWTLKGTKI